MHALSGTRKHVLGRRRELGRRCARRRLLRRLESLDRLVESQPVILQDLRGNAACIADDRSQNDGAIDVAAPAAASGSRRGLQYPHQSRGHSDRSHGGLASPAGLLDDEADHIAFEAAGIDCAGNKNVGGIRIVTQGREHVFQ